MQNEDLIVGSDGAAGAEGAAPSPPRRTRRRSVPARAVVALAETEARPAELDVAPPQPVLSERTSAQVGDRTVQATFDALQPGATVAAPTETGAVPVGTNAGPADEESEGQAERSPGRRRRSRRGRRGDATEEGADADRVIMSAATETPTAAEHNLAEPAALSPLAETEDRREGGTADSSIESLDRRRVSGDEEPQERRRTAPPEGTDGTPSADGREPRQTAPLERQNRGENRNRPQWRDAAEPREYRDGARQPPRDRQIGNRERGFAPGRDGRQNGGASRDNARDAQGYREGPRDNGVYREPAGYRDAPFREAPARERVPEVTPPPRPAEVVTRGYVIAMDQNQNQWQLRTHGHLPSPQDALIPLAVVRANGLRVGDEVVGLVRAASGGRRFGDLLDVQSINGVPLDRIGNRPRFDDLTPIYPDRHMRLERPESITARIIDIVAPVGFGQRALVVSPPKAGKTTILKEIGRSININYPDVKLIVCLVGERPEEVTDLAKTLQGEVISSTFDEAISHHTELAEITIERARRLVESGFDVVVLLDSVTRLARAYNLAAPGDSRSLSGGMATSALYPPKRFFGAARALQEGGSLTVLATCLVDTNSRLDDVIYEELKGTGNMELVLDRRLAEERVFPAIDIVKSSTRREELLLQPNELMAVHRLRRALGSGPDQVNSTQRIIQQMERTRTNAEFLASLLTQSSARG